MFPVTSTSRVFGAIFLACAAPIFMPRVLAAPAKGLTKPAVKGAVAKTRATKVRDATPRVLAAKTSAYNSAWKNFAPQSLGAPQWDANIFGFVVRDTPRGRRMTAEVGGASGRNVWMATAFASQVAIEAPLQIGARIGRADAWSLAGIGLFSDARNFWHLALVQSPAASGARKFVELSEMKNGVWNAQSENLPLQVLSQSGDFAWEEGREYSLRLTRANENGQPILRGEVFENNARVWEKTYLLSDNAVSAGRPFLAANAIRAEFGEVRADVKKLAVEPKKVVVKAPPYLPIVAASTRTAGVPAPQQGSGFFRTFQQKGKWWILDPRGAPLLAIGTDHVSYDAHWSEALGFAPYHKNVEKKYGSEAKWAQNATRRLRAWNFQVLGAGNSPSARYQGLAHTEFVSFGSEFSDIAALVEKINWTGFPDVFDARWAPFCDLKARSQVAPHKNDAWLLGYFLDNELEWWGKPELGFDRAGMALETAKQPATSAGKQALSRILRTFYKGDLAALNGDFSLQLASWDDFVNIKELKSPASTRSKAAINVFIGEVARRYFQTTTAAIRRYDPNHMILGSRFAGEAPDAAWQWAGKTCDIVTYNTYPRLDLFTGKSSDLDTSLRHAWNLTKKPIIITEWSFPALDAFDWQGRPLPSEHGAGMRVDSQAQRARAYALFMKRVLREPFIVGSHYFMWADEPALGISKTFPEDSNYGLVNDRDESYAALTSAAKNVNAQAMALHAGAPFKGALPPIQELTSVITRDKNAAISVSQNGGITIIDNGILQIETAPDALKIARRENGALVPMGFYRALQQQVVEGENVWSGCDAMEDFAVISSTPQRAVFEATFRGGASQVAKIGATGDAKPIVAGAQPWKSRVRFTMESGLPYFIASTRWVENAGTKPWKLAAYFHYVPSQIGGDALGDEPGTPSVPNYWLSAGVWNDAALKLQFGAFWLTENEKLFTQFWKDESGGQHPDALRQVGQTLQPGARWNAPPSESQLAIFALSSAQQPRPWTALKLQLRQ